MTAPIIPRHHLVEINYIARDFVDRYQRLVTTDRTDKTTEDAIALHAVYLNQLIDRCPGIPQDAPAVGAALREVRLACSTLGDAPDNSAIADSMRDLRQKADSLERAVEAIPVNALLEAIDYPKDLSKVPPFLNPKQSGKDKVKSPAKNAGSLRLEARNKWVYKLLCDPKNATKTLGSLLAIFKQEADNRDWHVFSTINRLRQVAIEYAKKNGLEPPPPRQNT